MRIEPGDFGPEFVTAASVKAWLDRLTAKRETKAPRGELTSTLPIADVEPVAPPSRAARPAREGAKTRRAIPKASLFATLVLVFAVWAASGFYRVQPDQAGIVLRFGARVATLGPGLQYHWPYPIEFVLLPRVTAINQLKIGNGTAMQMLTGDENIVEATASISWRVRDPPSFFSTSSIPKAP